MVFGWGACTGIKKMLLLMAENLFLETGDPTKGSIGAAKNSIASTQK